MIPKGWTRSEISKLAAFKSGGTPSKSNAAFWGNAYPWVSAKDLKFHYIRDSIDKLSPIGFDAANKAQPGDILILVRGMTLLKDVPVGKVVVPLAFNQDIKALTPKKIHGEYFLYCLRGQKRNLMRLVDRANHGTGRLSTDLLGALPILLPPLAEQKRIAEILSTWDRAIETTEKLIANSEAQKKALMQQLLTGKKRLPGFSGKWSRKHFRDAVDIDRNSLGQNTPANFKFRYVSLSDVSIGKIATNLPEVEFASAPSRARRKLDEHDILMATVRPNLQAFARVSKNHAECIASTGFAVLTAKSGYNPSYIYHYLFSEHLTGQIDALVVGSSYPAINSTDIQGLAIICPEEQEQAAIARVLNAFDAPIAEYQNQLSSLCQEKAALMQQLLTGKRRVKINGEAQAA